MCIKVTSLSLITTKTIIIKEEKENVIEIRIEEDGTRVYFCWRNKQSKQTNKQTNWRGYQKDSVTSGGQKTSFPLQIHQQTHFLWHHGSYTLKRKLLIKRGFVRHAHQASFVLSLWMGNYYQLDRKKAWIRGRGELSRERGNVYTCRYPLACRYFSPQVNKCSDSMDDMNRTKWKIGRTGKPSEWI